MSDTEKYHTDSEVFSHDTALVLFKIQQPQIFHSSSLRLQLSPPLFCPGSYYGYTVHTGTHTRLYSARLTLFNKLG